MKTKVIAYALLPVYQLANIVGWIAAGLMIEQIKYISIIACMFMAAVGIYSARKIAKISNDE